MYVVGKNFNSNKDQFDHDAVFLENIEDLTFEKPSVCILALDEIKQDQALMYIHSTSSAWNWLIFVEHQSRLSPYLSDGKWNIGRSELIGLHNTKLTSIPDDPADKLLAWLWLGQDRELDALCDTSNNELYYYPLVRCYFGEDKTPFNYLNIEEKQGYLTKSHTVDKVRFCPSCQSGHQNYTETCPSCKSTDIEETISLHCFTCGHVGKQDQFMRRGKLECPTCLTQLRHIGVDYDRPLENYTCSDCNLHFAEAIARAKCLSCRSIHDISELITRKINTYRASEQVKTLMMYGRGTGSHHLNLDGLIDDRSFYNLLVWTNKLAIRHELNHLLFGIQLVGIADYSQQAGEHNAVQLADQISNGFNQLMRNTDICCQYNSDMILLLMPMTPIESLEILKDKINDVAQKIDTDLITLNVRILSLPDKTLTDDAQEWLFDNLKAIPDE
ncbi:hypothetical protein DZ860_01975 [Vibrio sinensis]|uniref:Thaumarchaeal output domain-containing protein n=2 Tax=Vibrio sinensis TaxID=2302434 RepID=A0A3A6QRE2_9VIBR|nr:hypothetical protein DZ860_01975 [Vibrio sinensis]